MVSDPTLTEHQPDSGDVAPPSWGVQILSCPDERRIGERHECRRVLRFGRSGGEGLDVALDDRRLSRRHATLRRRGPLEAFTIEDEGSKNGTHVDGRRVERADLRDRAIIRIGSTVLEFGALPPEGPVPPPGELLGDSAPLRAMLVEVDRVAASSLGVLLLGETGTGKELVARRVHAGSGRTGELVAVNCAAIPRDLAEASFFGHRRGAFTGASADAPGYFRRADGGTLFLDELGELPLSLQPKLLRALETGMFVRVGDTTPQACDVRLVAATNVDLRAAIEDGRFRADLYARIAGYVVHLPPLRTRRADVLPLLHHFLRQASEHPPSLEPAVVEALVLYRWPMNVRELRSLARRLALHDGEGPLRRSDLPPEILQPTEASTPASPAPASPSTAPSRDDLAALLTRYRGSVAQVASHLGKDRRQIYRWLKKAGLAADDYR